MINPGESRMRWFRKFPRQPDNTRGGGVDRPKHRNRARARAFSAPLGQPSRRKLCHCMKSAANEHDTARRAQACVFMPMPCNVAHKKKQKVETDQKDTVGILIGKVALEARCWTSMSADLVRRNIIQFQTLTAQHATPRCNARGLCAHAQPTIAAPQPTYACLLCGRIRGGAQVPMPTRVATAGNAAGRELKSWRPCVFEFWPVHPHVRAPARSPTHPPAHQPIRPSPRRPAAGGVGTAPPQLTLGHRLRASSAMAVGKSRSLEQSEAAHVAAVA